MVRLLTILLFLPLFFLHSEVRYVSKTGSSTPPYTSPEIACDSIQKCINFAASGDTIYIDKGIYTEELSISKKVYLIGAGSDSTIIRYPATVAVIYYYKGGGIEGVTITNQLVTTSAHGVDLNIPQDDTLYVSNVKIFSSSTCIGQSNGHLIVENCYLKGWASVVTLGISSSSTCSLKNNITFTESYLATFSTHATILNNLFYSKGQLIYLQNNAPHLVANNICISEYTSSSNSTGTGVKGLGVTFLNNLVSGYFEWGGLGLHLHGVIKNNIVINSHTGVTGVHPVGYQTNYVIKYNNFYNPIRTYRDLPPDSTNIDVFPMFNSEAQEDFRLQKYSPLIDAGDPDILDLDGTRSDMGPYGGPYGKVYEYEDRAPLAPVMTNFSKTDSTLTLSWRKNRETDITGYHVYRDTTVAGFGIAESLLAARTNDTTVTLAMPDSGRKYYYRVSARDSIGNESPLSSTVTLVLTSVGKEHDAGLPEQSGLSGNYPNPFNPTTTITYRLKERSYVKLYIYTIQGELYELRVNEEQEPGIYRHLFNPKEKGTMSNLSSGIYFYMLEAKGTETNKFTRETGKMVLVK